MTLKSLRSIICPLEIRRILSKNYSFLDEKETNINILSTGDNDHYILNSNKNRYVFRVYRRNKHWLRCKENYQFEFDLLNFLKAIGFSISCPIVNSAGEYLLELNASEGTRYGTLFEYISGKKPYNLSQDAAKLAKVLSQMHLLTENFHSRSQKLAFDLNEIILLPQNRILNFKNPVIQKEKVFLEELCKEIYEQITNLSNLHVGVIHGDFHYNNYIISDDREITLLDFDLSSYGYQLYDIAIFRWSLFWRKKVGRIWDKFINQYSQFITLSAMDLYALKYFILARQIWIMSSHTTYQEKVLSDEYWNFMFAMLKKINTGSL